MYKSSRRETAPGSCACPRLPQVTSWLRCRSSCVFVQLEVKCGTRRAAPRLRRAQLDDVALPGLEEDLHDRPVRRRVVDSDVLKRETWFRARLGGGAADGELMGRCLCHQSDRAGDRSAMRDGADCRGEYGAPCCEQPGVLLHVRAWANVIECLRCARLAETRAITPRQLRWLSHQGQLLKPKGQFHVQRRGIGPRRSRAAPNV